MSKKHFQDFAKEIHIGVMNGAPTLEIELVIDIVCKRWPRNTTQHLTGKGSEMLATGSK